MVDTNEKVIGNMNKHSIKQRRIDYKSIRQIYAVMNIESDNLIGEFDSMLAEWVYPQWVNLFESWATKHDCDWSRRAMVTVAKSMECLR